MKHIKVKTKSLNDLYFPVFYSLLGYYRVSNHVTLYQLSVRRQQKIFTILNSKESVVTDRRNEFVILQKLFITHITFHTSTWEVEQDCIAITHFKNKTHNNKTLSHQIILRLFFVNMNSIFTFHLVRYFFLVSSWPLFCYLTMSSPLSLLAPESWENIEICINGLLIWFGQLSESVGYSACFKHQQK